MSIKNFIQEMSLMGIELWADEGKLRFKAPKGILSDTIKNKLIERKEDILNFLKEENKANVYNKENNEDISFPITDMQSAYLLGRNSLFTFGDTSCQIYFEFEIKNLDLKRMEQAWNILIQRHPMLRAVFDTITGTQKIISVVPFYKIIQEDLRGKTQSKINQIFYAIRNKLIYSNFIPNQYPLFSVQVTILPDTQILHICIDLLIADAMSVSILLEELDKLYTNPDLSLPPLEISFEHALSLLTPSSLKKERDKEYWLEKIKNIPNAPQLPIIQQTKQQPHFTRKSFVLNSNIVSQIKNNVSSINSTLSSVILTAYASILSLWSKSSDFTLNITLLHRPDIKGINNIIGDFTSSTLLEVHSTPESTFKEMVHTIQKQLWEAIEHNSFNGVEVIRNIRTYIDEQHASMPVVFTSTLGSQKLSTMRSLGTSKFSITKTPQVWIDCQAIQQDEEIIINWDCREEIFPEGILDNMFETFKNLIISLTNKSTFDKNFTIYLSSNTFKNSKNYIKKCLHEPFIEQVSNKPNQIAVIDGLNKTFTYEEIYKYSLQIYNNINKIPHNDNDFVSVILEKGWKQIITILAIHMAGLAYVPIDPQLPKIRKEKIIEIAQPCCIICDKNYSFITDKCKTLFIDDLLENNLPDFNPKLIKYKSSNNAYAIFTSGSTGIPKGVVITHDAALNTINSINERFKIDSNDTVLAVSNLSFDLSVFDVFGMLAAGGAIVIPDATHQHDPSHWTELIEKYAVTIWNSVPALLQILMDYAPQKSKIHTLRLGMLSGDWIPITLVNKIFEEYPSITLQSLGGATEAAIWSITYPITKEDLKRPSIPYGKSLENQHVQILGDNFEEKPTFVPGNIYISGEGLAVGYLREPEKTANSFIYHPISGERLYKTGDIGCYLPDGNIEFLGREDHQVKIHGYRIELSDIESCINTLEYIKMSIVRIATINNEKYIIAYIIPQKCDNNIINSDTLKNSGYTEIEKLSQEYNIDNLKRINSSLNYFALNNMYNVLIEIGALSNTSYRSIEDIIITGNIINKYKHLVLKWLYYLEKENFVSQDAGKWIANKEYLPSINIYETITSDDQKFFGSVLVNYFITCENNLKELLSGTIKPLDLLFPNGSWDIAEGAYRDSLSTQITSRVVCAFVKKYCEIHQSAINILEIGGGIGGLTSWILPSLPAERTHYTFTDISQFFISYAKNKFYNYTNINYSIFDINKSIESTELPLGKIDIILAHHVLHNANSYEFTLTELKKLLHNTGWIIIIESTVDNPIKMSSVEFIDGLTNTYQRKNQNSSPFLNIEKWQNIFLENGAKNIIVFGNDNDNNTIMSEQCIIAAQFENTSIDVNAVRDFLSERLPSYMIPSEYIILKNIPLTSNGKINYKSLPIPNFKNKKIINSESKPKGNTEIKLASIWEKILDKKVSREDNFYSVGGDSLLLTRLVSKIREEFKNHNLDWEHTLRQMITTPTIKDMASWIDNHTIASNTITNSKEKDKTIFSSPVQFLHDNNNTNKDIYLFHGGDASIMVFNNTIQHLSSNYRVMGVIPENLENYISLSPNILISTLAREYASSIKKISTNKPIILCGFCMGGLIALETSLILQTNGISIESLIVINSMQPQYYIKNKLYSLLIFLEGFQFYPEELDKNLLSNELREAAKLYTEIYKHIPIELDIDNYIYDKFISIKTAHKLSSMSNDELLDFTFKKLIKIKNINIDKSRFMMMYKIYMHSIQSVMEYKPGLFPGTIQVIAQEDETPFLPSMKEARINFWQEKTLSPIILTEIKGNRFSSMEGNSAIKIAKLINSL